MLIEKANVGRLISGFQVEKSLVRFVIFNLLMKQLFLVMLPFRRFPI